MNGTEKVVSTQVPDSKLITVSIVVGNMTFTKGTDYDVSVTATNSIGTSEPVTGTLSVPSECVLVCTTECTCSIIYSNGISKQMLPTQQHLLLSSLHPTSLHVVLE